MKIITISGLDGSGKSTQIEMLKNYLEQKGKKVFYFHAIDFSIANKIARSAAKNSQPKSVIKASWFSIQLRKLFLKIDNCRFKKLVNKLNEQRYDYFVSDRYFYDSVVNIEYLQNKSYNLSCITKSDVSIYLQVSPDIIMQRERIPDQGIEYLKKKKELYDAKISEWDWKVINGNRDKNVIFEEIKNLIN